MNNRIKGKMIKRATRVTSLLLIAAATATTVGCKFSNYENIGTTAQTAIGSQIDVTTDYNHTSTDYECTQQPLEKEESYEELLKDFNSVIKKYPEKIQIKLRKVFNKAYSNYGSVYEQLKVKGVPRRDIFMRNIFIEALDKNVKSIEFLDPFGDDYDRAWEESDGMSYFEEQTGKIVVMVEMGSDNKDVNDEELMHEIIHASQVELIRKMSLGTPEYYIWGEGEASAWARMLTSPLISFESQCLFGTEDKLYTAKGAGNGAYCVASRYYMQLLVLLGYNEMQQFKKNINSSKIINDLSSEYGIDGKKYYENIQKVMNSANCEKDEYIDLLVQNDATFKNCLMKKLSALKSAEEIKDFFDIYRMMNIQYGITYEERYVKNDVDIGYIDKTKEKIDNSHIENELFKKMQNIGAFDPLSTVPSEQRQIFDTLLYLKAQEDESYLPYTLKKSNLSYDGENVIISNKDITISTNIKTHDTTKLNKQVSGYNMFAG